MAKASSDAIKAGEAFVELVADDSKFNQTLKSATDRFTKMVSVIKSTRLTDVFSASGITALVSGFGGALKSIGGMLTHVSKLTGLIGSSAIAAFGAAAIGSLRYVASIGRLAERTGQTTEAISALGYVAKQAGTDLATIEEANKQLNQQTLAAANGSEEQAAAFRKLGMEARTFARSPIDEKFVAIAETLEGLTDPLDRSRFLIALFGDNASKVLPILSKGGEGLRNTLKEAVQLGESVNSVDASKSIEAMKAFDQILTSAKTSIIEVGLSVLELFGDLKEGNRVVLMYLKMFRDWAKENRTLVATIAIVVGVITALAAAGIAVGVVLGIIGGAISGIVAGASALVAVLGLITVKGAVIVAVLAAIAAGLAYLGYQFFTATELGKKLSAILRKTFGDLGDNFKLAWNGIVDSIKNGNLENAFEILTLALYRSWKMVLVSMVEGWNEFTNFFVDGFSSAVALIRAFFAKLVSDIKVMGLSAVKFIADQAASLFGNLGIKELEATLEAIKKFSDRANAQIDIELKKQIEVRGEIFANAAQFQKDRKAAQDFDIQQRKEGIRNLGKLIEQLNEKAKIPLAESAPGLPVAPMPRAVGEAERNLSLLGNSTRGLFNSSDFKGALGIGDANAYAKQAVDLNRQMLAELKGINNNLNGQVWV